MRIEFTIVLDDFEGLSLADQQAVYLLALEPIIHADVEWLLANPDAPDLYASGVRFHITADERAGKGNRGPNIPAILKTGVAHCVGLSCWRIAELRVRHGIQAVAAVHEFREDQAGIGIVQEFHVFVQLPDGTTEDPSDLLGMP